MKGKLYLGAFVCTLLFAFAGCGSGENVAPVHGSVSLDAKPIEGAKVLFQPVAGKRPSIAVTDASGNFKLMYAQNQPGAEVGKHRVEIRLEQTVEKAGKEITLPDKIPAKYNNKTTLEKDVVAGNNDFKFELTTK